MLTRRCRQIITLYAAYVDIFFFASRAARCAAFFILPLIDAACSIAAFLMLILVTRIEVLRFDAAFAAFACRLLDADDYFDFSFFCLVSATAAAIKVHRHYSTRCRRFHADVAFTLCHKMRLRVYAAVYAAAIFTSLAFTLAADAFSPFRYDAACWRLSISA